METWALFIKTEVANLKEPALTKPDRCMASCPLLKVALKHTANSTAEDQLTAMNVSSVPA